MARKELEYTYRVVISDPEGQRPPVTTSITVSGAELNSAAETYVAQLVLANHPQMTKRDDYQVSVELMGTALIPPPTESEKGASPS